MNLKERNHNLPKISYTSEPTEPLIDILSYLARRPPPFEQKFPCYHIYHGPFAKALTISIPGKDNGM